MSICELCEHEMLDDGASCVVTPVPTDTGVFHPIAFGSERVRGWKADRCGDCGVPPGGFHHRGCDMEECPRCRGQLISCGCDVSESPYDNLFDEDDLVDRVHVRLSIVPTYAPRSVDAERQGLRPMVPPAPTARRLIMDANERAYRDLARAVGGHEQLRTLDTVNPLPDESFSWAGVAADNRVAVLATLAVLDRTLQRHAVPLELTTACRRFLADLARSPVRQLRPTADGARIAAGVVWAVFTANESIGSRCGWRTGTVWSVFGVTPSARRVGVALRQTAIRNRNEEFVPADDPALGHAAFYTLRMRRQMAARAAVLREIMDRRAS